LLCLTHPTDPSWVEHALGDLDAVLLDHAHCEMKAASNALSLAARSSGFPTVVRALVALAEEELSHFRRVLDELDRRGVALGDPPVDEYAVELRKLASSSARGREGRPGGWLVERLLVGAIIEARSCERFRLLADALVERGDAELASFYEELFAAEARHFRTFVDLAEAVAGDDAGVRARLAELARAEGALASRLGVRASVHG
jgi:tRNA-(ms[2]io[6]A)-hydroxylase